MKTFIFITDIELFSKHFQTWTTLANSLEQALKFYLEANPVHHQQNINKILTINGSHSITSKKLSLWNS
jgi:hypothetical protein